MEAVLENEVKSSSLKAEVSLVNLQHALKVIAPVIPGPNTPIHALKAIHIEQLPDGLAVRGTDTEASVLALIPEITSLASPLILSSERFIQWIKMIDGDIVKLNANGARVSVQCGQPKVSIPRVYKALPSFSYRSEADGFEIEQSDLLRLLKHTIIAVGEETRFALNGILLEANGEQLNAVATDGNRMVVYSRPLSSGKFRYLIPEKMLRLLQPVIVEDKATVRIQEEKNSFLASVAADVPVFVTCIKPAAGFPNWEQIMPKSFQSTLQVDSASLLRSMNRCLLMGDKKTHAVAMEFTATAINLKAVDALAGEAEEVVAASGGPAMPILVGVNGTYLSQALKHLSGEIQVLLPPETSKPILFRSTPSEGEVFNYIVMPMRINR